MPEKEFLTVKDIQDIMFLGRNKAYDLVNAEGFPKIRIGKTLRIPADEFKEWVKKYSYKDFIVR